MKERKEEKIKYKVFTLRLHEGTKKQLLQKRKRSGKSWNLFILGLLNNEQKHRN